MSPAHLTRVLSRAVLAALVMLAALLSLGPVRVAVAPAPPEVRSSSRPASEPTWSMTEDLNTARLNHTATLLLDGWVLVVGGTPDNISASAGAEVYDPATGHWTRTENLNTARYRHTATLLLDGQVLVAGGLDSRLNVLSSTEVYDPATGLWTPTGDLNAARFEHSATLLSNGQVLVAGGLQKQTKLLRSAELYDPATGQWTLTGEMDVLRTAHTATSLPDGRVLVAGGFSAGGSAELYDPATQLWTPTGTMNADRFGHTATPLFDGQVLVAGGAAIGAIHDSTEVYDPAMGRWTPTGDLRRARLEHTATPLPDGRVLVAGGLNAGGGFHKSAELYDPAIGSWASTATMNTARALHTATPLLNGRVLVTGGFGSGGDIFDSAELFIPSRATTVTTLESVPNPSVFGQTVTFTATVTASEGTPSGRVIFRDGAATLGGGTLGASGVAHLATSTLTAGSHAITAVYEGDAEFGGSISTVLNHTVTKAHTTTAVSSFPNPSLPGQIVTSTAHVRVDPPGAGRPTGTVTFAAGTTTHGPIPLSEGSASVTTTFGLTGTYIIEAEYSGDGDFEPSTGFWLQTVGGTPFDLSVAKQGSSDSVLAGENLTYTITLTNTEQEAVDVTVSDFLPGNVSFVSSAVPPGWTCQRGRSHLLWVGGHLLRVEGQSHGPLSARTPPGSAGTVECSKTLAGNTMEAIAIVVNVPYDIREGVVLTNTAQVMGNRPDPDVSDNRSTVHTTVLERKHRFWLMLITR